MKNLLIFFILLMPGGFHYANDSYNYNERIVIPAAKFSDLSEHEKQEAIEAFINGDCNYKGIKLWGKIKFVTAFPDIKIQYVENFPDIRVKFVSAFPDECGLWQIVENFPDIKVQVVENFPDIKVKVVENFPGIE